MKHYFLSSFILLLLFSGEALLAQTGAIKGTVRTADGQSASYVNVGLKGTTKGTQTNAQGAYTIDAVQPGNYTLVVSLIGLETKELAMEVKAGETTEVPDVVLKENTKELQEVVISAGQQDYKADQVSSSLRLQTKLVELPQNIQVVNRQLLSSQQSFDMLEGVTRNVSGAMRIEHWDNYARINMRGSTIAAFRNGMNVAMPWGPLTEDLSMIERIEFVKGPAGFMMANGEPGGFYNVVTKKPTGITKGEANVTLGSFDTYRASTDLDGKLSNDGKLLYRLNLMGQLKGSHRDYEYNNRYSIVPVLTYRFNDNTSLTAEYTYQFAKTSPIGSAYVFSPKSYGDLPVGFTTSEPNLEPTTIKDHSILLILNHKLNANWSVTGQLAYYNYSQIGSSLWPSNLDSLGNLTRSAGIWDASNESKIGQVFVTGEVKTGPIVHRILGGLDMSNKSYMADWSQSYNYGVLNIYNPVHGIPADSVPRFDRSVPLRIRASGNTVNQSYAGLYVQDELRFWEERIRLTLAGRYTTVKESEYGTLSDAVRVTPRVGLSVSLMKDFSVYGLYDQAFVPQAGTDYNKKKFDPITGDNLEAGIKKDWFNNTWNSTVSVYQITRNNVLTADPEHVNFSKQIGQTETKGLEVDIRGEIVRGLNLVLNYAYTDSKVTKDTDPEKVGKVVPGFAKHLTNAWLSYRVSQGALEGLGFSIGYQWQIERSTWTWNASDKTKNLPDYFRLDGGLSWQKNRFHAGLNINNLLNTYLYSGAPYDVNFDGKTEYYWQTEPKTNFRLTLGCKF